MILFFISDCEYFILTYVSLLSYIKSNYTCLWVGKLFFIIFQRYLRALRSAVFVSRTTDIILHSPGPLLPNPFSPSLPHCTNISLLPPLFFPLYITTSLFSHLTPITTIVTADHSHYTHTYTQTFSFIWRGTRRKWGRERERERERKDR